MYIRNLTITLIYIIILIIGTITSTIYFIGSSKGKKEDDLHKIIGIFTCSFMFYVVFEFLVALLANSSSYWISYICMVLSDTCYFVFITCWVIILRILSGNTHVIKNRTMIMITAVYAVIVETLVLIYKFHSQSGLTAVGVYLSQIVKGINLIYDLLLIYIACRYLFYAIFRMHGMKRKKVELTLSLIFVCELIIVVRWDFFTGMYIETAEGKFSEFDPLLMVYLAVCIFALYLFYKKDFWKPPAYSRQTIEQSESQAWENIVAKYKLTARETEIMKLIQQGYSSADIGNELFIALTTVKKHLNNILRKTGTQNKYELLTLIVNELK